MNEEQFRDGLIRIARYSDYKEMENSSDERKKRLTFISFLGSLFVLISGILFLSIAILDENIDVEIAFS